MLTECFEIQPNRLYRIVEKVEEDVPEGLDNLKKAGKYKMVSQAVEPITCAYYGKPDDGYYDTGLTSSSRDFANKSQKEIDKTLKERAKLIEHYEKEWENYKRQFSNRTEVDFVASDKCSMEVKTGDIIDTSSFDKYFRLWLSFRGGQLTPTCERSNPLFNYSLFEIQEIGREDEKAQNYKELKIEALSWMFNEYAKDPEHAKEILVYLGVLTVGRNATKSVALDLYEKWLEAQTKHIDDVIYTKEHVERDEIITVNKISLAKRRRKIVKEGVNYMYGEVALGRTDKQIYESLFKEGNEEILEEIMGLEYVR
jgi:hypothetical protein